MQLLYMCEKTAKNKHFLITEISAILYVTVIDKFSCRYFYYKLISSPFYVNRVQYDVVRSCPSFPIYKSFTYLLDVNRAGLADAGICGDETRC